MLYASLKGGGNTSAPPLKGGGGRRGDSGLHGAPALAADVMHSPGVRFTRRVARRAGTGTGLRKPEKGARRRGSEKECKKAQNEPKRQRRSPGSTGVPVGRMTGAAAEDAAMGTGDATAGPGEGAWRGRNLWVLNLGTACVCPAMVLKSITVKPGNWQFSTHRGRTYT